MKLSKNNQYRIQGFTLVEMLVVIAIVALLAGIGFGAFMKMQDNAKANKTRLILESVASAMEARSNDITQAQRSDVGIPVGQTYPTGAGSNDSTGPLIGYISGSYGDGVTSKLPQVDINNVGAGDSFVADVNGNIAIVDGWGTPLQYTFPGIHNSHDDGFDLVSAGADETFGTPDDIILE